MVFPVNPVQVMYASHSLTSCYYSVNCWTLLIFVLILYQSYSIIAIHYCHTKRVMLNGLYHWHAKKVYLCHTNIVNLYVSDYIHCISVRPHALYLCQTTFIVSLSDHMHYISVRPHALYLCQTTCIVSVRPHALYLCQTTCIISLSDQMHCISVRPNALYSV